MAQTARTQNTFKEIFQALKRKRMWINLLMGFSAGLPIMLVFSTVKIWMRREGIDLSTVGMMSWVALPYSLNFIMGPILDRYIPTQLGRRRSWILMAQIGIVAALVALSFGNPKVSVVFCVVMTLLLAFFSATQDVAIDAYKREILPDEEIGMGSSIYVYGYRVAMLMASGVGLWMVDPTTLGLTFNQMFLFIASLMSVGVVATFIAVEPKVESNGTENHNLKDYVIEPFKEFFSRQGVKVGAIILSFIFLFKFGDALAGTMLGPFYVDMGYSNRVIAEVTKGIGFISTMVGLGVGALAIFRFGIVKCLVGFGILQAISTALFSILAFESLKGSWWGLAFVVGFEDFAAGLGTTALISFMASMTDKRYTATQYALFASLAALGKTLFGGFSGIIVEKVGYVTFFYMGSAIAIPGLILIYFVYKIQNEGLAHAGGTSSSSGGGSPSGGEGGIEDLSESQATPYSYAPSQRTVLAKEKVSKIEQREGSKRSDDNLTI